MQYSPNGAVPSVSMVDAGTVELVRGLGVEVATSANLIQYFESRWTREQLDSHLEAGRKVDKVRGEAFDRVGAKLRARERVTEWEMQQFILKRFAEGLGERSRPDVAVNANASNPHYEPKADACSKSRRRRG
jgi:Xaa-Pro aminopeptidase